MTLIKTSLLNGIAVGIKMLTLLGVNKALAVHIGPTGYALLGQFQNAVQMITTFASGAINLGVTKYTAEYHAEEGRQHAVWRTAGSISITGAVLSGALVAIFNRPLAEWFLQDKDLGSVFLWFSATLPFFVLNTLLLAILNGKKQILKYVTANIMGSLLTFAVTIAMTIQFGLYGALVSLAVYQSLSFVVTFLLVLKSKWFKLKYLVGAVDKGVFHNLARYTLMALTSAIVAPLSLILIRNHLGETLGWEAAGYWEAMWRLSAAYLMLISSTLGVYYLPRLSELNEKALIKQEIVQGYRFIFPLAVIVAFSIYLLRDFIIEILFAPEFKAMADLFAWQMVGDTFRVGGWLLSYVMVGKAMTKLFISSEIIISVLFYLSTIILTRAAGLEGVAMAHALTSLCYWIFMAAFIPKALRRSIA